MIKTDPKPISNRDIYTPEMPEVRRQEVREVANHIAETYEAAAKNITGIVEITGASAAEDIDAVVHNIERMEINHHLAAMDGALKYRDDPEEMEKKFRGLKGSAALADSVDYLSRAMVNAIDQEEGEISEGGKYVTKNGVAWANTSPETPLDEQHSRFIHCLGAVVAIQYMTGLRKSEDGERIFLSEAHLMAGDVRQDLNRQLEISDGAAVTIPLGSDMAVVVRQRRHYDKLERKTSSFDITVISTIPKSKRDQNIQHQSKLNQISIDKGTEYTDV